MSFKKNKVVKLEGLNFERFLHFITQNKIKVWNLNRHDVKVLEFSIIDEDYFKIKRLGAFKNYSVTVVKSYGVEKYTKKYLHYIGLVAGILLSAALFAILSSFTFNISVKGLTKISKNDVVNYLNEHNIKTGKINTKNNHEIELMLKNKFEDISLVSVIKQGTNIIINIKEKEHISDFVYAPIVAKENMIITSLVVNQGTAVKKIGDIVKKGDVIVESFMLNEEGKQVACQPIAALECEEWHIGVVEFENEKIVRGKTKNKIVNKKIVFGDKYIISESSKEHSFKLFETVKTEQTVLDIYFVPIKIVKETVYEIKEKKVLQNFDKQKDALIKQAKQIAYKNILNKADAIDENIVISTNNNLTIVQVSVQIYKTYKFGDS